MMVQHLERLRSFLIQGQSDCHVFEAVSRCSGGKLVFKNCQHQIQGNNAIQMLLLITVTIMIIASKFILKMESTRDHIDLILSQNIGL